MNLSLTNHPISQKGFNYVTVALIFGLVIGGWMGYHYVPAYLNYSHAQTALQEAIYANLKTSDEAIIADAVDRVYRRTGWVVSAEKIQLRRSEDQKWIRISFHHSVQVPIPLLDKIWSLPFEPVFEKDLTLGLSGKL